MSFFFTYFPTVDYDFSKRGKFTTVTDITKRFKLKTLIEERGVVFYDYIVKDSDRPDIIAEKLYGDSKLDWIIFLANDIIDPYYDWPLNQTNLDNFIASKYGSISAAQAGVHHYEWILKATTQHTDGTIIPEKTVEVTLTKYNTLTPANRRVVTNYDYEFNQNEKKRQIKLLDEAYVDLVLNEYKSVLND